MGKITIKGLRLTAYHGVFEQERKVGNEFEIDLWLDVPITSRAMQTDNLDDTISYADVVEIVRKEMAVPSRLLEHVAGRIRAGIIGKYGDLIQSGEITVKKLAPPISAQLQYVSFTTEIC